MIACPTCGGTEFEKRGNRRVRAVVDADLQVDGWTEDDYIEWDGDAHGDTVYCLSCDTFFSEDELRACVLSQPSPT